jgi:replicative superfamily II helicase
VFDQLYLSDSSVFLGVPSGGSEGRVLAELVISREIQKEDFGKIVYICPHWELCKQRFANWNTRLGTDGLGLNVELLSDDFSG